jgi:hypothetical protein
MELSLVRLTKVCLYGNTIYNVVRCIVATVYEVLLSSSMTTTELPTKPTAFP